MVTSFDDRGDTWVVVALCCLVVLVVFAGGVGLVCLFAAVLDAALWSALAGAFAEAAVPYEILLFALWIALRPLNPLFPLFGIPTDFPPPPS
jgi:hypothetical protein